MIIAIDAGHGGRDPGAVVDRHEEDDIALDYSVALDRELRGRGHETVLVRPTTEFVALSERARRANDAGADCYISNHANASARALANGVWVIHYKTSTEGRRLAGDVFEELRRIPGIEDEDDEDEVYGDRTGWTGGRGLAVLRLTRMPAIVIELGFLTNPRDLEQLLAAETRPTVAEAVADGIEKWAGLPSPHIGAVDSLGLTERELIEAWNGPVPEKIKRLPNAPPVQTDESLGDYILRTLARAGGTVIESVGEEVAAQVVPLLVALLVESIRR